MTAVRRWLLPGAAVPDLLSHLPCQTPVVTLHLLLAPVGERGSATAAGRASAFEAHLMVGGESLVVLLRRDGIGTVELATATAEALGDELDRVLDVVGSAVGRGEAVRLPRDAYVAMCAKGPGPEVLARATRVLEATILRPDGVLTGALWYDADGWWRVQAEADEVVLSPSAPRARDWAPLLDQVLT